MKRTESELASLFEVKFSFLFEEFKKLPNYGQENPTFIVRAKNSNTFGPIKITLLDFDGGAHVEAHGGVHTIYFKDDTRIAIIYASNKEEFDWLYDYHSYFSSIILGRIFKSAGLKYSHEGLRYIQYDLRENHKSEVGYFTITKDFSRILNVLKLDVQKFRQGFSSFDELFSFIVKSPFFNAKKWINSDREHKTVTLQRLEEYIFLNKLADQTGEKLTLEYVRECFPEIEFERLITELEEKAQKKFDIVNKLNGQVIMKSIPGFEPKNIGISISIFKQSFGSKEAFAEFLMNNTQEEVISKFKEVNQIS